MIFEDGETLNMYVEESLEHLENIENNLLAMESAGADIDDETVNTVFRAAHSIKGGAGFLGLTNIKELSHKLENVIGMIRDKEIVPDSEIVSILLKAFDRLSELIDNIGDSDNMDVSGHIASLAGITTTPPGITTMPPSDETKDAVSNRLDISIPDGEKVFQASRSDIERASQDGQFLYIAEYDLINDFQKNNKDPLAVMTALLNSGDIIESKVDIATAGTLEAEPSLKIPFYVLFSSIIGPDIITSLFDISEKCVHLIPEESCVPAIQEAAYTKDQEKTALQEDVSDANMVIFSDASSQGEPEAALSSDLEPEDSAKDPQLKEEQYTGLHTVRDQSSIRVSVELLDTLMTLAGELVLSRNQLIKGIAASNDRVLKAPGQRIDMVTSELQETIMRTRMQKIANVFNKFPRVVRDFSIEMGKEVDIIIEGKDVELDKTIIETISDPLNHLVRNAVDHGIEDPEVRRSLGKDPIGILNLKAFYETGQVNVEISDDGRGIDGEQLVESAVKKGLINTQQASSLSSKEKMDLIFLPGFSTADKVTDVSGRGVGMDVVKTNLEKLGGIIDIDSTLGKGTTISIKLPLTLAIIPSQIISIGKERYAIPQVNLDELLRIPASQVQDRIERIGEAEVVRLRGNLLPLLNFSVIQEAKTTYVHPDDGQEHQDRRRWISDRRSQEEGQPDYHESEGNDIRASQDEQMNDTKGLRKDGDRRDHETGAVNIAVVSAGVFKYGLLVDRFYDSEEIVVKPLGRHFKNAQGYAGATIMGDGKVALILDVAGIAQMADLTSLKGAERLSELEKEAIDSQEAEQEKTSLLIFNNGRDEHFSVPLSFVERIEQIRATDIEYVGGKKIIQYRRGPLVLHTLDEVAKVSQLPETEELEVIVFSVGGREIGLMVEPPVDAVDVSVEIDNNALKQPGIIGSVVINERTTLMIDIFEFVRIVSPEPGSEPGRKPEESVSADMKASILFAEDSDFFREQVKSILEDDGFNVFEAEDGVVAWESLEKHGNEIQIVVTDLEMPRMDGFKLTEKIKKDERFSHLPVIALSSLAGDEDIRKGKKAGIDDFQIKLDRDKLLERINEYLKK